MKIIKQEIFVSKMTENFENEFFCRTVKIRPRIHDIYDDLFISLYVKLSTI